MTTAAELIRYCEEYQQGNGILALLSLLEDIIEVQAQSSGVELLSLDDDEIEVSYFTVQ